MANLTYGKIYSNRSCGLVCPTRHHRTRLHKDQSYNYWENVSTIIFAWDSDLIGVGTPQTQDAWEEKMMMQDPQDMNYTSNFWTMSSIQYIWTQCEDIRAHMKFLRRKASELWFENHHRGYQGPCVSPDSSYEETSFPWSNQSVASRAKRSYMKWR